MPISRWCRCSRSATISGLPRRVRRITASIKSVYGTRKIAAGTSSGRIVPYRLTGWFCA
ncbi:MAG: hypothetical protein ACRDPD_22875 [Streptosporangiaceae bacterium]